MSRELEQIKFLDEALIRRNNEIERLQGERKTLMKALAAGEPEVLRQFGYREIKGGWLPLDICACAIEETEQWNLEPEKMALIDRIETIFFFDRNAVTHCCEITPSYELHRLETRAIFKDPNTDDPVLQQQHEEIDEDISNEPVEEWIEYVHCHEIEPLEKRPKEDWCWSYVGNPEIPIEEDEDEETFHSRVMQAVREGLQGNSVL